MTEVEAGGGFVDVVGVVEDAGEFEGAFEDDEGGVVAALAEVEAKEEVVTVGAEGRAEVHWSRLWYGCRGQAGKPCPTGGGWFELWSGPLGLASKRVRRGVYGGVQEF